MAECLLCGHSPVTVLIEFGSHPIAHHFLAQPDQAEEKFPVTLAVCATCGHVQLVDPAAPENFYENYHVLSSWKPQPHVPHLADLIAQHMPTFQDAKIIEVGANDGIFLRELRARGCHNLLGVEPAADARHAAQADGFTVLDMYFTPQTAERIAQEHGQFDIFIARQVLEHINDVQGFGRAMQTVLKKGALVVIEVPNFAHNLANVDYTIWEEHINYFTLETLTHFFQQAHSEVLHSETILFSGEILTVLGRYHGEGADLPAPAYDVASHVAQVQAYADHWQTFQKTLTTYLKDFRAQTGKQVVIYGSGCRSCSLVNFADLTPYIDYFVDDQAEKQNLYMPGSRLPIYSSQKLDPQKVGLCLLAVNGENEDKVMNKHTAFVAGGGRFASILPPSQHLLEIWDGFHAYTSH